MDAANDAAKDAITGEVGELMGEQPEILQNLAESATE